MNDQENQSSRKYKILTSLIIIVIFIGFLVYWKAQKGFEDNTTTNSSNCECRGNTYNCSDFSTHAEAQKLYRCCMNEVGYDIHELDRDEDEKACESLK